MSNKPRAEILFSYSKAIPWRVIDPGLCVEGRCLARNGRCQAYQQMVIGNFQMGQFTISSMSTLKCPMCGNNLRADKFAFNR
jgi:hypothetical protein